MILKKMMTGTKLRLYSKRASCKNSMIYEHSSMFIIAGIWEQTKYLLTDNWINKT